MKDAEIFIRDIQGSLQAVRGNPDGRIITSNEGQARTTNPTAVSDGASVSATFDDVGRQLMVPYQVRDLVTTARAVTATLAEVALIAGAASTLHDLLEVTGANSTGVAVTISLRDNLAGGIVKTLIFPANDTRTFTFPVPVPQSEAANSWTIQNAGSGDISDTVVTVSATFVKNV